MIDDSRTQGFHNIAIERIKNGHVVSTRYGRYAEVIYNRPQIVFFTNREVFGYFKNLSRDRWDHMKITDDYKLIKLGWTDANLWDSMFDSTTSKEPTVENNEKTFDQANDDYYFTLFCRLAVFNQLIGKM